MSPPPRTHLILGASRGIGHELARQLLARGDSVLATVRSSPTSLSALSDASPDLMEIGTLDISDEESVKSFAGWIGGLAERGALGGASGRELDSVLVNAGVLEFPNRVLGSSFNTWSHHLTTNTIGPLTTASALLTLPPPQRPLIRNLTFISSDSGSATNFLKHEDGFAAYAASKAALNMGIRHLAAELERSGGHGDGGGPAVVAMHPGEVWTDMAKDIDEKLGWEVEGRIGVEESVGCMLETVRVVGKGGEREKPVGEAAYVCWDGRGYAW